MRHRAQISERTQWKKEKMSVVRSFPFYCFFPLRFPLLIRFHTDKKRAESAVVKEAYLTKHVWLEKKEIAGIKGGEKINIRSGLCALVLGVQKDVPLGSVRSSQAGRALEEASISQFTRIHCTEKIALSEKMSSPIWSGPVRPTNKSLPCWKEQLKLEFPGWLVLV